MCRALENRAIRKSGLNPAMNFDSRLKIGEEPKTQKFRIDLVKPLPLTLRRHAPKIAPGVSRQFQEIARADKRTNCYLKLLRKWRSINRG